MHPRPIAARLVFACAPFPFTHRQRQHPLGRPWRAWGVFLAVIGATLVMPERATAESSVSAAVTTSTDTVPAWAKSAIWYQIFPERFRNGDPSNDPTVADQDGAFPHDVTSPWQIHPWTSDWYELQPYEKKNGRGFWFNLQRRRYGGDLQGILDELDYLQRLGISAVWTNPIFTSPSSHKYDGATYHHVDPNFGPDPAGDRRIIAAEKPEDPKTWKWTRADRLFLRLVKEMHRRGMRIVLDGVFNHMSVRSWPFQDLVKNLRSSPFRDWFTVLDWNMPGPLGIPFKYSAWFGVPEHPELRQDENGTVAGPREYIYAITRRWMDPDNDGNPSDGIDGWRLDVAFCIKHPFWKAWRKVVKSINPQAYLVGEVVESPEKTAPYLQGDELDAVMNYNFTFACWQFFVNGPPRLSARVFDERLLHLRQAFRLEVAFVMQNLLSSHDTIRPASHLVNASQVPFTDWGDFFKKSSASNPKLDTRTPDATERKMQRLLVAFQMTYLGAPIIYYGDEAGMWGANDPCCRKPMVWEDLQYAPEAFKPDGTKRAKPDPVVFDRPLFDWYRRLTALRRGHSSLRTGDFTTLRADQDGLYAFARSDSNERIVVVLNRDTNAKTLTLDNAPGQMVDLLGNGGVVSRDRTGRAVVTVGPIDVRVLGMSVRKDASRRGD